MGPLVFTGKWRHSFYPYHVDKDDEVKPTATTDTIN